MIIESIWVIVGKCSIPYNDLFCLSLEELSNIAGGWFEGYKANWEIARETAYWSFMPHAKEPKKLKPTSLMKFSWDKEPEKMNEEKQKEVIDHGQKLIDIVKNGRFRPHKNTNSKPDIK